MRIITLGDLHGRTNWKSIASTESFDRLIFIGDYFDTHEDISINQQKKNFKEIADLKRSMPQKVVLLIGNHDFHYLRGITEHYSGFQPIHYLDIQAMLEEVIDLLSVCFQFEYLLFSHAGVTSTWCTNNGIDHNSPAYPINQLFVENRQAFGFAPGSANDPYGNEPTQGPLWVRPPSLLQDHLPGFIHIAGHTTQEKIVITKDVILIDTLGTSGEYLIWEDGKVTTGKG